MPTGTTAKLAVVILAASEHNAVIFRIIRSRLQNKHGTGNGTEDVGTGQRVHQSPSAALFVVLRLARVGNDDNCRGVVAGWNDGTNRIERISVVCRLIVVSGGIPRIKDNNIGIKGSNRLFQRLSESRFIESKALRGRRTNAEEIIKRHAVEFRKFLFEPVAAILVLNN